MLYGSYARHPLLMSEEHLNERIELIDRLWGTGDFILGRYIPTVSVDEARRRAWARFERQSATPTAAMAVMRMNAEIDTRAILPTVRVPTLITHRVGDRAVPVGGRLDISPATSLAPNTSNCPATTMPRFMNRK